MYLSFKKYLVFTAISVFFFSCQKELSNETGTGSGGSGGGGGTGGGSTGVCKDCIYIPMCDGSWYTYNDTLMGTAQLISDTLKYVKDTTISSVVANDPSRRTYWTRSSENSTWYSLGSTPNG